MRVAVLGGTISGTVAARELGQTDGLRVDLFRNLNDPKRSISNLHPLCEYQAATFVLRPDDPPAFAAEARRWLDAGLVEDAPPDFWAGRLGARGGARRCEAVGRRLFPRGGFFAMLDALAETLPASVDVRAEQLERMSRDGERRWWLEDRRGNSFGPYDVVLLAFDALPRAVRKASEKQLLESALPHSSTVIAASARAQMTSCMSTVLHFDPPLDVPYDTVVFEDIPELQFAARNPKQQQHHRGIQQKHDTWTVVATPEWSLKQRPDANGRWDKTKVGKDIIRAFGRALGCDTGSARQVVPTFHWQGCSYITQVEAGPPCAFDGEVGLGWCGDQFGGLGPAGAVASGLAAASLAAEFAAGRPTSALPGEAEWGLRQRRQGDEDIGSIVGPGTGRREPDDGLDHTWETAMRIARGAQVKAADSYKKFRRSGPMGDNRPEGPWAAVPGSGEPTSRAVLTPRAAPGLRCQRVDDGILKVTGLAPAVQGALLRAVFPAGARGVCGGLYDARRGSIDLGDGSAWPRGNGRRVAWSELGLHGHHTAQWDALEGGVARQVLKALQDAAPDVMRGFAPDCVRVAFENMRGRTIGRGQTLCGWSRERDRADGGDTGPKVCVLLGSAARIWHGYKYAKEDRESLDVELSPGDALILYGPGRSWVSAVSGFEAGASGSAPPAPFDFAHVWLLDHRRLRRARPEVYASIHEPPAPTPGGAEYKWMQFAYEVLGPHAAQGDEVLVQVSDGGDIGSSGAAPAPAAVPPAPAPGRRWRSKATTGASRFEQNWVDVAGA